MVALRMYIKDLVVFLHVWLKKPSLQVQGDVKEVDNFLVDSNKVQGEAICPENFVKFLPGFLCAPGGLVGDSKPVIFISSNVDVEVLELAEEVEHTDVTALTPIIGTHCDVKVLGAFFLPNVFFIIIKK